MDGVVEFDPNRPRAEKPKEVDFALLSTDIGRAEHFARQCKGFLFWLPASNCWLVWDPKMGRWNRDDEKSNGHGYRAAQRLASSFLKDMMETARREKRYVGDGEHFGKRRTILDMLDLSKDFLHCSTSAFDQDHRLLGVENGVVDLTTGALREASPQDMVTIYAPTAYKPEATSALWDGFLNSLCRGDDDFRDFLQLYLGYCLFGSNERETFTIFYGPGGTGKSTLAYAMLSALGPYAITVNQELFSKRKAGNGPRDDIAAMDGKRLAICMELPHGHTLDAATIKMLSGGDDVWARGMYRSGSEIRQTWTCIVACNEYPIISGGTDSGWRRRILVIPFLPVQGRLDYSLKRELQTRPENREAILSWLIAGCLRYQRAWDSGRDPFHHLPQRVKEATAHYRLRQDHVAFWVDSCLDRTDPSAQTPNTDLWKSYEEFCEENEIGYPEDGEGDSHLVRLNSRQLGRRLSRDGFGVSRTGAKRHRIGLRLKERRVNPFQFVEEEQEQVRVNPFQFVEEE